ncbi:MAG: glycosyltransferase family A protein [Candidatus Aenigmatarchaeota archaeon]
MPENDEAPLGIVTPVKNESANLARLALTIFRQTKRPATWIIVDDGSTDETPQVIASLKERHDFIDHLPLQTKDLTYDPIFRYGALIRLGFEHAKRMRDDLKFLGVLDADILLKSDYYDKILTAFDVDSRLGIISGIYVVSRGGNPRSLEVLDTICGGAMVFRKECLLNIGGFPVCPSPDTAAMIKAVNRGWRLGVVSSVYAVHTRVNESWTKFVKLGLSRYILSLHPLSALFSGLLQVPKSFSMKPLGFTIGYIIGAISNAERISDEEVKQYFHGRFQRSMCRRIGKCELDPIKLALIKL